MSLDRVFRLNLATQAFPLDVLKSYVTPIQVTKEAAVAAQVMPAAAQPMPPQSMLTPPAPAVPTPTTSPAAKVTGLHADKLPGAAALKSTIQDMGPISTVGNVNGNAGQGVKNMGAGAMKLAAQKLAAQKLASLLSPRQKQAALKDILEPAAATSTGALLGAGIAGLTHPTMEYLFPDPNQSKKARHRRLLYRMLTGAGVGGVRSAMRYAGDNYDISVLKHAALDPAVANAIGFGGAGAAIGGVLGGLDGLIAPGSERYTAGYTPEGHEIVKTRKRNRLSQAWNSAVSGAITGGAVGGIGGGLGTEGLRMLPYLTTAAGRKANPNDPIEQLAGRLTDGAWAATPRDLQHKFLSNFYPAVYDNPFSRGANRLFGSK